VIDAQAVQDGRVQVVDADAVLDSLPIARQTQPGTEFNEEMTIQLAGW
jgi:hypothetical protein